MARIFSELLRRRFYIAVSVAAAAAAGIVASYDSDSFARFFGPIPGPIAIALAAAIGLAALMHLEGRGFHLLGPRRPAWVLLAAGATFFAATSILGDAIWGYPSDLNILPPGSILFYPSIGLAAEALFHLAPLAVITAITRTSVGGEVIRLPEWPILFAVAAVEPAFQVLFATGHPAGIAADVYIALSVFGFGLFQVVTFRFYGFWMMFYLRLVHYFWWHGVWAVLRL